MRTLQAEDQAIAEDKVKIEEYKRESDKLRKIIHALKEIAYYNIKAFHLFLKEIYFM